VPVGGGVGRKIPQQPHPGIANTEIRSTSEARARPPGIRVVTDESAVLEDRVPAVSTNAIQMRYQDSWA